MSSKQLPEGWCWGQVGTVSNSIQYGYTASASKEPIGPQMLRITDIQDNKVNWDSVPYCSINPEDKGKYLLRDGDLVFARTGATVGKSFLIKGKTPESVYASYLIRIRLSKNISDKYLYLFFQSVDYWRQITEGQVGIGQPNVNGTKLSRLFFPVAPLSEQHQIVARLEELFSDLDDGIASLKKAQEQLKTYRQAVLKYAFEGKLTAEWRKQHQPEPAETLLEQIKTEREQQYQDKLDEWQQTCEQATVAGKKKPPKPKKPKDLPPLTEAELAELPELPEGWCWVKSSELFLFVTSGSRGWAKFYADNGALFIRMGNLKHATIDLDLRNIQYVKLPPKVEGKRSKLKFRDLLISITADVGMIGVVPESLGEAYINQHIALARPVTSVSEKYLSWFLAGEKTGQKQFLELQRGATKVGLGLDDIRSVKVPLCSLQEQNQIVQEIESRLSVCDQLEQTIANSLQKAESLRQSILKQAFEGKLTEPWRKAHPDLISGEYSAAALLERIRTEKEKLTSKKR